MQKIKKDFKKACYFIFAYVGLSIAHTILSLFMGDVTELYPNLGDELVKAAVVIVIALTSVSSLIYLWLGFWGLSNIKNNSAKLGNLVLEFILSVFAFFNLYDAISALFDTTDLLLAVINLVMSVLCIAVLLNYDWHSMKFRRALLDKKD